MEVHGDPPLLAFEQPMLPLTKDYRPQLPLITSLERRAGGALGSSFAKSTGWIDIANRERARALRRWCHHSAKSNRGADCGC